MRSVPDPNPTLPPVHFPGGVTAQGRQLAYGAATGGLAGMALMGLAYRRIGWVGLVFPLAGVVFGSYVWAAAAR